MVCTLCRSLFIVQSMTQLLTLLGIDFWSLGGVEEGGVISVHHEFANDAIRKYIDIQQEESVT